MPRVEIDLVGGAQLHDAAEIHDRDPVGDVPDDTEVVGDEEIRQVEVLLERQQQVQDLRLYRDVERRDGLVANDELRAERECPRDADALTLTARELVRRTGCSAPGSGPPGSSDPAPSISSSPAVLWIANGAPMI